MPTKEQIISNIQAEKYFTVDEYTTHIYWEFDKFQIRNETINEKHVKRIIEVVELYDSEDEMDPVVVVYNGTQPVKLIDGNHTLEARLRMGVNKTRIVKVPIEEFGDDEELILRVSAGLNNPEKVSLAMSDSDIKYRVGIDIDRDGLDYVKTIQYRDQLALDMGRAKNGITRMINTVLAEKTAPTSNFQSVSQAELNRFACHFEEQVLITNSERVHNTGLGSALVQAYESGEPVTMIVYHRNAATARTNTVTIARNIVDLHNLPITVVWYPTHEPKE